MANLSVTSPNGTTTFTIEASWVARLLDFAGDVLGPDATSQEKEAWVRRRMFVELRNGLLEHERAKAKNAASDTVDAMPVVES